MSAADWLVARDRLRTYVRAISKDDTLSKLVAAVTRSGEPFLFGGAARDVLFVGSRAVGDLDIFVSGHFDEAEVQSLSGHSRRTNFGGFRLLIGRHDIDIWELPESYAFKVNQKLPVSIPDLLRTVCFSTDAVAISIARPRVLITSPAFDRSFKSRQLFFVNQPAPNLLVAVRAARLLLKLGLRPSEDIARYVLAQLKERGMAAFIGAEERWKGRRVLDSIALSQVESLCEETLPGPASIGGEVAARVAGSGSLTH